MPSFTRLDDVRRSRCRARTTSRSPRRSTSTRCATATCRSASTSTAPCSTAATDDRLQVVLVPWSCTARWSMPVDVWRRTIAAHYPGGGWIRLQRETLEALGRRKAERGLHTFDDTVAGAAVSVERMLSTLLYEGYALYPYTPGATKNATPTPFGIVYPPVYAAGGPHTFDRARMQLVLEPGETRARDAAFLSRAASATRRRRGGSRSRPTRRSSSRSTRSQGRVRLADDAARRRAGAGGDVRAQHDRGRRGAGPRRRRCARRCARRTSSRTRRAAASPRRSPPARPPPRRSPQCDHVNIFPVLATDNDDTVLGRDDRAARPSADRAREPRRPVRRDGDRGGAAAARARAQRRRARGDRRAGPEGARDARARRRGRAGGRRAAARARHGRPICRPCTGPGPADVAGEPRDLGRRRHYRRGAKVVLRPGLGARPRTASGPAAWRRSSGSTATTRTACTSRSPST